MLVGLEISDDAAVYKISEEVAVIQTLDFFTPVVDDACDYGAIAAANAMSLGFTSKPGSALEGLKIK